MVLLTTTCSGWAVQAISRRPWCCYVASAPAAPPCCDGVQLKSPHNQTQPRGE